MRPRGTVLTIWLGILAMSLGDSAGGVTGEPPASAAWAEAGMAQAIDPDQRIRLGFRRDSSELLAAGRAALGVDARGRSIRSLELNGQLRTAAQPDGDSAEQQWIGHAMQIRALLPDHYLRIARRTSDDSPIETRSGFSAKTLLNQVQPPDIVEASSQPADIVSLLDERQAFARLMLLVALHAGTAFPLTLRPQDGSGTTLAFAGRDGFVVEVDLDRETLHPVRLRQLVTLQAPDGRPGEPGELIIEAADRRDVNGVQLPFRITSSVSGRSIEEIRVHSARVNPPLMPQDFKR